MERIHVTVSDYKSKFYVSIDGATSGSSGGSGGSSDWNDITNKPVFALVATTGSYNNLSNIPSFSSVAYNGNYNSLLNLPIIPAAQIPSDWNATTGLSRILNKPTIPAAQIVSDWTATSGLSRIINKPVLSTVANTGLYSDLINRPVIPAAQVNCDWNSTSGISQIINKPVFATVATSGNYVDLINKPDLSLKVDKITGKQLSTEDFTTTEKTKLASLVNYSLPIASDTVLGGIKIGSGLSIDVNGVVTASGGGGGVSQVNSDWNSTSGFSFILNKPDIGAIQADSADLRTILYGTIDNTNAGLTYCYNQISSINIILPNKVDKITGKQLSTEDFTNAEKTKLSELANYSLPIASGTILGGIKIGSGLSIDVNGVVTASGGGGGGSGLTNFTDTLNIDSPNEIIPTANLTATGTQTNIDLVIKPKGNGSIIAAISDGTNIGGNKRGRRAVDFMIQRGNANQVAGGDNSGILSGASNRIDANGAYAIIVGGDSNVNNSYAAFIGSGLSNSITGGATSSVIVAGTSNIIFHAANSIIGAGQNNTISVNCNNSSISAGVNNSITTASNFAHIASGNANNITAANYGYIGSGYANEVKSLHGSVINGTYNKIAADIAENSTILNGSYNTIDSKNSVASGKYSHTKGINTSNVFSSGNFTNVSDGKIQNRMIQLRGKTTGSSTLLSSDGTNSSTIDNQILIPSGEVQLITGTGLIRDTLSNDTVSAFEIKIVVRNVAGVVSILSNSVTSIYSDASAVSAGYSLVATANSTTKAVNFTISKTSVNDIVGMVDLKIQELNY